MLNIEKITTKPEVLKMTLSSLVNFSQSSPLLVFFGQWLSIFTISCYIRGLSEFVNVSHYRM